MPRRVAPLVALLTVLAFAQGASAEETTTIQVDATASSGGVLQVQGTIVYGNDATGPIAIAEDPQGDAQTSGVGLDFGDVTIAANPAARSLTYRIEVYDMPPVVEQTAPLFGYVMPTMVDGDDGNSYFLAAGNAGANFPPATGPFYNLCVNPAAGYSCPTSLVGSMDASGITFTLPYFRAGIEEGSLIESGGALGCSICSTAWPVVILNDTGGDSGFVTGYTVPGEIEVGLAPAGTPPEAVEMQASTLAGTNGRWAASLPSSPGEKVLVMRSCWGSQDAEVCVQSSADVTV